MLGGSVLGDASIGGSRLGALGAAASGAADDDDDDDDDALRTATAPAVDGEVEIDDDFIVGPELGASARGLVLARRALALALGFALAFVFALVFIASRLDFVLVFVFALDAALVLATGVAFPHRPGSLAAWASRGTNANASASSPATTRHVIALGRGRVATGGTAALEDLVEYEGMAPSIDPAP